jgi:hypothetical protein
MLAERSRTRITVPTDPLPDPRNPPKRGRATAKMRAVIAKVRQIRMRICLSFFFPRDSREAFRRKLVAAQSTMRKRRLLSRWMITGIEAANSPQRIGCERKLRLKT